MSRYRTVTAILVFVVLSTLVLAFGTYNDPSSDVKQFEIEEEVYASAPELIYSQVWQLDANFRDSDWSFQMIRLTQDSEGNKYIVDATNNRLIKLNSNKEIVWNIGHVGHEFGNFIGPRRIDTFGRNVFVEEGWNNRIQVFRNNGEFLYAINTRDYHLSDFAAGSEDRVFIADLHSDKLVSVFDNSGRSVASFGDRPDDSFGSDDTQESSRRVLLDVDEHGNSFVIVYEFTYPFPRLQKYNSSYVLESEVVLENVLFQGGIWDLVIGKDNVVYVITSESRKVICFNPDLSLKAQFDLAGVLFKEKYGILSDIDRNGNLIVITSTDYGETSIKAYSPGVP